MPSRLPPPRPSREGRYWLQCVVGLGALSVTAAVALSALVNVCLTGLAVTLLPPGGSAPWFQDPGDPGGVVPPRGADLLAVRIVSEMAGAIQGRPVLVVIAIGWCIAVWASSAAVDVLVARAERGWWWRALVGTAASVALGSVGAVVVHASTPGSVSAAGGALVAGACVPSVLRRLSRGGSRVPPVTRG